MLSVPPGFSVETENTAEPRLSAAVPMVIDPCRKVTGSPSGGAPRFELTRAVNFTVCPYIEGFSDDDSMVAVVAGVALRVEAVNNTRTIRMAATFMRC